MIKEEKVAEIIKRLSKLYPKPRTALQYRSPWELLVATILSAQATDKLVNTIIPSLFEKFTDVCGFAKATVEEIDQQIRKVNFHHNKAKSIHGSAKIICERYQGKVPDNMEELDALPGVARKTANVVLGDAFGKAEGIVVDTHVLRLSKQLGLSSNTDPVKVEADLMKIVPKKNWIRFAHYLILYGREYHNARTKELDGLPLNGLYK